MPASSSACGLTGRNSRWVSAALFLTLLVGPFGCGGGGSSAGNGSTSGSGAITAPSNLTYSSNPVTYRLSTTVRPDIPTVAGGTPSHFSINPALPAGLTLDPISGVISGVPTAITEQKPYAITASNSAGSTTFSLVLTVLDTAPDATIFSQPRVFYSQSGLKASVPTQPGMSVQWTLSNGTATGSISSGGSSSLLTYSTGPKQGDIQLSVSVTNRTNETAAETRMIEVVGNQFLKDPHFGYPRYEHTSTVLKSGRVLLLGGYDGTINSTNSANLQLKVDIYDPMTDMYSSVAAPRIPRIGHSATLLQDGRVLVVGGNATSSSSGTAEIYDPIADSWTNASSPSQARSGHTAVLLPNGKVLVVGGLTSSGPTSTNQAEVYNPDTDSWTATGPLPVLGTDTATLLPNGKVLVSSPTGATYHYISTNLAQIFDPISNSWYLGGHMIETIDGAVAATLANGKVLLVGGGSSGTSCQLYDPISNTWSSTGSLPQPRIKPTATLLPNGNVFLISSNCGAINTLTNDSSNIYNTSLGVWTAAKMGITTRFLHTANLLQDGKVYVMGGLGGYENSSTNIQPYAHASHEVYDPSLDSWTGQRSLAAERFACQMIGLKDGRLLVTGGGGSVSGVGGKALTTTAMFDPYLRDWAWAGDMNTPRAYHTATLLPDGRVLVAGGEVEDVISAYGYGGTSNTEIFDPSVGTWSMGPSMICPRQEHTAVELQDGRVLMAGGTNNTGNIDASISEIFDPITNVFSGSGKMDYSCYGHTATLLMNGKVLIAGGSVTGGGMGNLTDCYDPVTGSWSLGAPRAVRNTSALGEQATLLSDGREIVCGGGVYGDLSAEVYNESLNSWSNAGSMLSPRNDARAVRLPDGTVLVIGGTDPSTLGVLSSAERYDPVSMTWSPAGNLTFGRSLHGAAVLPDGTVMVVGGIPGFIPEYWKP